ncbi:hypothetical protein ACQPZJ_01820 [Actinoplanes sp. CA-054009]
MTTDRAKKMPKSEQQANEMILLAGLVATIKIRVDAGADLYEILDTIPGEIHSDVVEGLHRLGMI